MFFAPNSACVPVGLYGLLLFGVVFFLAGIYLVLRCYFLKEISTKKIWTIEGVICIVFLVTGYFI